MASLGAIIYVFALAIPRTDGTFSAKFERLRGWVKNLPFHHVDEAINASKDKFLRKAKIVVMKTENIINKNLNKDKDGTGLTPGSQA